MKNKDMSSEWLQYYETKDKDLKAQLIEHYIYLVKLVGGRLGIYLNQYIDRDDLVGYGILGLIDAIDKFDPTKNVKFETYASLRIRGAILDEIRKLDWVPRTLRKKQKDVDKARTELETQLTRKPTDEEIAKYLDITLDEYYELEKDVNVSSLVSIDENTFQFETIKDKNAVIPEKQVEEDEMRETLAMVIDKLPERERKVIMLYYFEELTLKEISKILDVSESRVSQLHTKAVSRLRVSMEKYNYNLPL